MQTLQRTELLLRVAKTGAENFQETALAVFQYQQRYNPLYNRFLQLLNRPGTDFPCLPIRFFKSHTIQTGEWPARAEFTSSTTTGQYPSRHLVRDPDFYLQNTRNGFSSAFSDPSEWCILALLPSYLERTGSSLVAMADYFIRQSRYPESGFSCMIWKNCAIRCSFAGIQGKRRFCWGSVLPCWILQSNTPLTWKGLPSWKQEA
jgi:hypothetical protein